MVAIRLSRPLSWSVVAAPGYFERHGIPDNPRELLRHSTIGYRFTTSGVLPPWSFVDGEGEFQLDTHASLSANDTGMIAELARRGLGNACLPDIEIENDVRGGRLQRILTPYVPSTTALFLYFPMRSQKQPKMRVLVEEASNIAAEGLLDITFSA